MKNIEFVKAQASGNDFIVIDRFRTQRTEDREQIGKLARQLCERRLSIGADGLLLLEPSNRADFKMRVFNPDGTEVEMCGNGARCIALYAANNGISSSKMVIETQAGNLQAEVKQDSVKLKMSDAKDLRMEFKLEVDGQIYNANYINTGVPHVVCFVQGLGNFSVQQIGRAIRYHPEFQPKGTNADFVEVVKEDHIKVRTYERGVEQETLACGTGCVAAGIITAYRMERPQGQYKIKVDTQGGETVKVYFNIKQDLINGVYLEGKAKIVYQGLVKGGLYV